MLYIETPSLGVFVAEEKASLEGLSYSNYLLTVESCLSFFFNLIYRSVSFECALFL